MKILIYVTHGHPHGPVDHVVSPHLAQMIDDLGVTPIAEKFIIDGTESPDLHRLTCAEATDDSVLDAMATLQNQIDGAKRWARRRLTLSNVEYRTYENAPPYIHKLWDKYPHALYRDLLGPEVAAAMGFSDVTPT